MMSGRYGEAGVPEGEEEDEEEDEEEEERDGKREDDEEGFEGGMGVMPRYRRKAGLRKSFPWMADRTPVTKKESWTAAGSHHVTRREMAGRP